MDATRSPSTSPDDGPEIATLASLPPELISALYTHLELPLLIRLASASRYLRSLAYKNCDPMLWHDRLNFFDAQYVDRGPRGRESRAMVRLGRVNDSTFLAIFRRIPPEAKKNIRSIILDYCEITAVSLVPILELWGSSDNSKLTRLSVIGCSRVFFGESELYRLVIREGLKVGLLGTHVVNSDDYSQNLVALSDNFTVSDGSSSVELSRFDHAVGAWTNPHLIIPTCSIPGCKSGPLDSGSFVFDRSRNECARCGIREHVCGDRWKCKGPGAGRCQRVVCSRRVGCGWCGETGCSDHDFPRV